MDVDTHDPDVRRAVSLGEGLEGTSEQTLRAAVAAAWESYAPPCETDRY